MRSLVLGITFGLVGCVTNATSVFEIDGSVQGTGAPPTGKVVFVWDTLQAQYKWGDGLSMNASFSLGLDPIPPPDVQITSAGMAVGIPILIDNRQTINDGVVDLQSTARLGVATDHAVIWKDGNAAGLGLTWDATFGASYSCAQCVRGGNGVRDSWELAPCANVTIVMSAPTTDICNWK